MFGFLALAPHASNKLLGTKPLRDPFGTDIDDHSESRAMHIPDPPSWSRPGVFDTGLVGTRFVVAVWEAFYIENT